MGATPLPNRSFGIMELGGSSFQVFDFKRFIGKALIMLELIPNFQVGIEWSLKTKEL